MPNLPLGIPRDLDKYFYNREKELAQLKSFLSSLEHDAANQVLVTGQRGVGKSFLLRKLMMDLPENILSAYLDLSKVHGTQKGRLTEEKIMHSLFEVMMDACGKGDLGVLRKIYNLKDSISKKLVHKNYDFKEAGNILGIAIPQVDDKYEKLSSMVMEFPQKVVDASRTKIDGFIIIIDEFQLIGELNDPEAFFWLIRSYTQEQDNVSYIFTGSTSSASEIVDKINGVHGAFGGRMIQFLVEKFSKEETRDYLKEKVSEVKFSSNGFDRFYKCTGGYPSYINSFCNTMTEKTEYNDEMVVKTFYGKLNQIATMWMAIWATLSDYEKEIVEILIEKGPLAWNELLNIVEFSSKTLLKYINRLKNKGILSHANRKYFIEDHMLSSWLKNRKEEDGFYPP
jgi:uncharacterized protein